MSGHTKWSKLRDELMAKLGAKAAMARARAESLEENEYYARPENQEPQGPPRRRRS